MPHWFVSPIVIEKKNLWGAKRPSPGFAVDSRGLGRSANARDRLEGRGASLSRLGYFSGSEAEGVADRRGRVPTSPVGGAAAQARAAAPAQ
jgi:hypothetical protein